MSHKTILKYKNYDVHSITTISPLGKINANIATWVMQSAMQGKFLTVALDKTDYTIQLVRESMILNVNLLAQDQAKKLIPKLGRKSGLTNLLEVRPLFLPNFGISFLPWSWAKRLTFRIILSRTN